MTDSFKARTTLEVGAEQYEILSLNALKSLNVDRLPFSLKILLENLLRFEDGVNVTKSDIDALLKWDPKAAPNHEIAFTPARRARRSPIRTPSLGPIHIRPWSMGSGSSVGAWAASRPKQPCWASR